MVSGETRFGWDLNRLYLVPILRINIKVTVGMRNLFPNTYLAEIGRYNTFCSYHSQLHGPFLLCIGAKVYEKQILNNFSSQSLRLWAF